MMCVNNLTQRLKKPFTMSECITPSGVPLKDYNFVDFSSVKLKKNDEEESVSIRSLPVSELTIRKV